MESLHFQLFQSFGRLFGFLRYAEKVGEHKTGRIGEQQAAGVDKPLLVCDYGQHQDDTHGLRSGAYVTKGGNERTADTGTQAGSEERFAQRESNTVNQGLADAGGQAALDDADQRLILAALKPDGQSCTHLTCACLGQNGQQNGHAGLVNELDVDGGHEMMQAEHDDGQPDGGQNKAGDHTADLQQLGDKDQDAVRNQAGHRHDE